MAATDPGAPVSRRRALTEADILESAAALFAARGFAATSVGDIADALGMSRPALYHYFASKDEILVRLMDGLMTSAEEALAGAHADEGPPEEALRRLVTGLIAPIAESPGRFRLLQTSDFTLSAAQSDRVSRVQRSVFASVAKVIEAGVASGAFRRVDQKTAAFAVLGMVNWVAWWYQPGAKVAVADLCETISDLALASLRAGSSDVGRGDKPASVIGAIRRELVHLEEMLGD